VPNAILLVNGHGSIVFANAPVRSVFGYEPDRYAIAHFKVVDGRALKDDREILLLSRFQELSFAEIAGILECSVGAAKVRAHRALRELRDVYFQLQKEKIT